MIPTDEIISMAKECGITKELAHETFDYVDGVLLWKNDRKGTAKAGSPAGWFTDRGYVHLRIDKRLYGAHQVIYLMHHGFVPKEIDHIDGNKSNNRIENLRAVSRSQNAHNRPATKANKSGVKGVHWRKDSGKWYAQITINRKIIFIGRYDLLEHAEKDIVAYRQKHIPEFANNGKAIRARGDQHG